MKLVSVTCLILTFCVGAVAQRMTDRDLESLKGNVQTVAKWSEDFVPGRTRNSKTPEEIIRDVSYDSTGNKTKSTFYPLGHRTLYFIVDGDKVSRSENFDVPGVSVLRAATPGQRDERFETKYKYEYDKDGRIVEIRTYMSNGVLDVLQKFSYDDNGRLVSETSVVRNKPRYEQTFKYGTDGMIAMSIYVDYDQYGTKSSQESRYTNYKLDPIGNWIERKVTRVDLDNRKEKPVVQIEHRRITYF